MHLISAFQPSERRSQAKKRGPTRQGCGSSATPDTAIQVRLATESAEAALAAGYDGMDIVMEAEE